MDEGCLEGQGLGERHVLLGPVHTMWACLLLSKSTNFTDNAEERAATSNGSIMVYMARCHFYGASLNLRTLDEGKSHCIDRCASQISCNFFH
jgi:hypothetical protein